MVALPAVVTAAAPVAVTTCTNVDVGTASEAADATTVDRTMLVTAAVPEVCALVEVTGVALVLVA